MQLTRLEIKGFKSFGDKVTINFDKGITGIVGPNGCGKSNVVDAIRWVLGEQKTRMLRSDKMENIIFNGTKKRKATQLAEVSLTFDNNRNLLPTEYTQVTITRRYYRSGDSEYLLNGVTCRLKDIHNLFMDTGIATNSYSIIELKMVDDLLNDKDNSRRQLFEEAAGISKFKSRKKETLKKLQDTDADLERVEDLLFEIEKNLKSLEKQAKQAEKYYQTKEKYKTLSITLARVTVSTQRDKLISLNEQLRQESDKKASLNSQQATQEALAEQLKADLVEREKLLGSRQKALNMHVEEIRSYESDKQVRNERMSSLQHRTQRLQEQLQQERHNIEAATESLEGLQWQKAEAAEQMESVHRKANSLKQEYEAYKAKTNALKEEMSLAEQAFRHKQDEVYQLKKSLEIKQMQLSSSRLELEKAATDASARSADLGHFDEKTNEMAEQLEALEQQLSDTEEAEIDLQERTEALVEQIEEYKEELSKTLRSRDAIQNEYNLTKSLVDNLEGFPEAIKYLKKNVVWAQTAPLLSDILTCSDEYRVSIENYLHTYMNYYVVSSKKEAMEAIQVLHKAEKGKANFFILDHFEHFTPAAPRNFAHAIAAINIVEHDDRYTNLVQYVLNNAYIVNGDYTLPDDPEASYITKDGRVIQHPFSLSGGSVGLFEGKRIGRARNLEKLKNQLDTLLQQSEQVNEVLSEKQRQLSTLRQSSQKNHISELQRQVNRVSQEYAMVKTKKEQLAEMLNSTHRKQEDTEAHMQELQEACLNLEPQVQEKTSELKGFETSIAKLNGRLTEENEMLSEKSAAFNQQNILYYQQENKLRSITQEIIYKEQTYETGTQNITKNQRELHEAEDATQELLESQDVSEDELLAMYEEKSTIETGVDEAEKDYYNTRGEIDKTDKGTREVQRQKEKLRYAHHGVAKQAQQHQTGAEQRQRAAFRRV